MFSIYFLAHRDAVREREETISSSTGSSGELPEGSFIESDRGPWARRSQRPDVPGGVAVLNGWAGVWGHCLGGTSTGSSGELPGAISSSWCSTFPGVRRSRGWLPRAAPEPRSAARAAVVAAAVPAVAGAFAVGGCGGGLFGFHGIVGGLFLGAAVALGYRLEQFFLRRHALQDRKSTRLNSSHVRISYAVFCLKK